MNGLKSLYTKLMHPLTWMLIPIGIWLFPLLYEWSLTSNLPSLSVVQKDVYCLSNPPQRAPLEPTHMVLWDLIDYSKEAFQKDLNTLHPHPPSFFSSFFGSQSSFSSSAPWVLVFQGVSPQLKTAFQKQLTHLKRPGCMLYLSSWTPSFWKNQVWRFLKKRGGSLSSSRPLKAQGLWIWSSHRFEVHHLQALTPVADRLLIRPFQRTPLLAHLRFPSLSSSDLKKGDFNLTSIPDFHFYAVHLPESPRKQRSALLSTHQISTHFNPPPSPLWMVAGGWWNHRPHSQVPKETQWHFTRLSLESLLKTTFIYPSEHAQKTQATWKRSSGSSAPPLNQSALLDFWISSRGEWSFLSFEAFNLIPPHWIGQRRGVGGIWVPSLSESFLHPKSPPNKPTQNPTQKPPQDPSKSLLRKGKEG